MSQHQHLEPQELCPRTMTAGSLLDLPNDVLHEVCTLLCLHCQKFPDVSCDGAFEGTTWKDKRARLHATAPSRLCRPLDTVTEKHERVRLHVAALANLCRTSRRFNTLAMPFLYHAFFLMTHQRPYFDFMRTLMQCPGLGTSVRQATFNTFRVGVDDIAFIHDLIEHMEVQLPKFWKDPQPVGSHVLSRDADAGGGSFQEGFRYSFLIDLFLSSAVNLERLSLQLSRTTVYGKFMLPSSSLQSLKSLHLAPRGDTDGFSLDAVTHLLQKAPNLENLEAYMCHSWTRGLNLPNLKVLTLSMCTCGHWMLGKLASTCKQLEAFTFRYLQPQGGDERLYNRAFDLSPREISDELGFCSKTLEYLEIQPSERSSLTKDASPAEIWNKRGRPLFHTLLPASIAKVTLKGADLYCLFQDLAELAKETESGLFPDLKRLDI